MTRADEIARSRRPSAPAEADAEGGSGFLEPPRRLLSKARRFGPLRFLFGGGEAAESLPPEIASAKLPDALTRTLRGVELPAMPHVTEDDFPKARSPRGGRAGRWFAFRSRRARPASGEPSWLMPFVLCAVLLLSVLPLARLAAAGLSGLVGGEAAQSRASSRA
ncbi:iron ABC transporter permease, partial [Sinorhizobium sp. 6-117]|nr:iron ABC transporter permease [Sinorhizobium sp. 6-117]